MGSTLAAIGRAQPSRSVERIIGTQLALNRDERQAALTGSELALNRERLIRAQNLRQQEEIAQKEFNTPIPVDALLDGIEGGPNGEVAQLALKEAKAMGLINSGEIPTVLKGHAMEFMQHMQKNAPQYNNARIKMYNRLWNETKQAAAEKNNDPKLLQQANVYRDLYNKAVGIQPEVERQAEALKEQERNKIEREKIAAANARSAEDRKTRKEIAGMKQEGKTGPEGYSEYIGEMFSKIDGGADPIKQFSEARKKYPSKAKELTQLEVLLKKVAELPEDLQYALEINSEKINEGVVDADKAARKLSADWPEHRTLIKGILVQRKPEEDLATALKAIFE